MLIEGILGIQEHDFLVIVRIVLFKQELRLHRVSNIFFLFQFFVFRLVVPNGIDFLDLRIGEKDLHDESAFENIIWIFSILIVFEFIRHFREHGFNADATWNLIVVVGNQREWLLEVFVFLIDNRADVLLLYEQASFEIKELLQAFPHEIRLQLLEIRSD